MSGIAAPLELSFAPRPIWEKLSELRPIEVRMVRGTKDEVLFRDLVDEHHYLGYRQIIGEHLRYIAFLGKRPLACIGWGAAAWKVACRDQYIGWGVAARKRNLQQVASNTRFLILPWVRVPHLASFLLGQQARVIAKDWEQLYAHPVVMPSPLPPPISAGHRSRGPPEQSTRCVNAEREGDSSTVRRGSRQAGSGRHWCWTGDST